jgi:hypothetical protein
MTEASIALGHIRGECDLSLAHPFGAADLAAGAPTPLRVLEERPSTTDSSIEAFARLGPPCSTDPMHIGEMRLAR